MSQPRYHPRHVRLWKIGSKCVDDQFLLAPTSDVYTLVFLFLAKMQELYDVELVGFVFMGNHFHILVRLHEDRLPDIMRDFKGGLAKALNRLHGRRGALWMERYDDDAVLDDAAAETALHYFHANPVRAHVVELLGPHPFEADGREEVGLDAAPVTLEHRGRARQRVRSTGRRPERPD